MLVKCSSSSSIGETKQNSELTLTPCTVETGPESQSACVKLTWVFPTCLTLKNCCRFCGELRGVLSGATTPFVVPKQVVHNKYPGWLWHRALWWEALYMRLLAFSKCAMPFAISDTSGNKPTLTVHLLQAQKYSI